MYWRQVVSQSPLTADVDRKEIDHYLDSWQPLIDSMLTGSSFSGRERNCCFLNTRKNQFADISAASGLNQIDDTRSIAVTDWDHDGDLDIWMTNRNGPRVRFLRNDLPTDNSFVAFRLEGDPDENCPRDAFGARVTLTVKDDAGSKSTRIETLYGGDSFISQSSKWIHFGLRPNETILNATVRWPGSRDPESFTDISDGQRFRLKQGSGKAAAVASPESQAKLQPSPLVGPPIRTTGRLKINLDRAVGDLTFRDFDNQLVTKKVPLEQPVLMTFWASWCGPCREELKELANTDLGDIDLVAVNIESATGNDAPTVGEMTTILDGIGFNGTRGIATEKLIKTLNSQHLKSIFVRYDLPLPVSFLIDTEGMLRVVYKGRLDVAQMKKDAAQLNLKGLAAKSLAVPFPGRWTEQVLNGNPVDVAKVHIQNGNPADGREFLTWYLDKFESVGNLRNDSHAESQRRGISDIHYQLARIAYLEKKPDVAFEHTKTAIELNPESGPALVGAVSYLVARGRYEEATPFAQPLEKISGGDPRAEYQLGAWAAGTNDFAKAIDHYTLAIETEKRMFLAANNLAWILATNPDAKFRDGARAVKAAELACEATNYSDHRLFDTLAVSWAEAGDFAKAIQSAKRGIELAKAKNDQAVVKLLGERIQLFQSGKPFRESREKSE